PQRFAGRDLFWWLVKLGLMDKSPDSALARRVRARGDLVIGTDRRQMARDGVDFRSRLVAADGRRVPFADGTTTEVDTVVWSTGLKPDFTCIDADVTTADGHIRHQGGRTDVPGLWVLGQPWQRTRRSSLLGFVERDAEHLTDELLLSSPSKVIPSVMCPLTATSTLGDLDSADVVVVPVRDWPSNPDPALVEWLSLVHP